MSHSKNNDLIYSGAAGLIGIRDKERMAQDEIRAAAERLTDIGFTDSEIHQYIAETWIDDIERLGDDEKMWKSDYFTWLHALNGRELILYRIDSLSLPTNLSKREKWNCIGLIETIALLKLISNDMSQTHFELVQAGLESIESKTSHYIRKHLIRKAAKAARPVNQKLPFGSDLSVEYNKIAAGPAGKKGAAGVLSIKYKVTPRAVRKALKKLEPGT